MVAKRSLKKHRSWFFTWNNYTKENIDTLTLYFKDNTNKYIFQEELGKNNTPHLQGCVNFKQAINFVKLKEELGDVIHLEKCSNFRKSYRYCCKEETRNGGIFSNKPLPIKLDINTYDIHNDLLRQALESCKE